MTDSTGLGEHMLTRSVEGTPSRRGSRKSYHVPPGRKAPARVGTLLALARVGDGHAHPSQCQGRNGVDCYAPVVVRDDVADAHRESPTRYG